MKAKLPYLIGLVALVAAFAAGRATAPTGLLSRAGAKGAPTARFDGGALGADDVRPALGGLSDPAQRRAALEQLVRSRILALDAEEAGLHRSPEFLRRYDEELAGLQLQKAFEGPFQKKLPTADEVRKFFDDNKARLGRPERVRIAHLALLAPASDAAARAAKREEAQKVLAVALRGAKDEYAFGKLALTLSDDPRSRPAAGELPFATREELAAQLGPDVAEEAFATKVGQLVDHAIETGPGFQLVKVLAHEEGREASFDELREGIRARLTAERHDQALKEFLDARWARADVKIDEKALAQVQVEKPEKPVR